MRETDLGSPQGGVISPLLANIYLDYLDSVWERQCSQLGVLVRYADDFVVLSRTESQAKEAMRRLRMILDRLRLTLHPDKTRVVRLGLGQEGFMFLGCYIRVMRSHFKGRTYVFRWPSPRAMARVRERVRHLTTRVRRAGMKDLREVVRDLNPVLRGWGNYFRTGNASIKFCTMDRYVHDRLVTLMVMRGGTRGPKGRRRCAIRHAWPHERFVKELGLYRLLGTVRYPGAAHAT